MIGIGHSSHLYKHFIIYFNQSVSIKLDTHTQYTFSITIK
jgi:hypothetical protein